MEDNKEYSMSIAPNVIRDNKHSDAWHWQEPQTAWKGIGIYHITLTVSSREPLLGKLKIPDNDPAQACVQRTELGEKIVDCLWTVPKYHPEIRIVSFDLMPNHLHSIWHVTRPMPTGIKSVVRGYWQAVKQIGREYSMSIAPDGIRNNKHRPADPIFTEMPFIRPLSKKGQLDAMIRYTWFNPQRLATMQLMPGYFRVQDGIEIAGRKYAGVGNVALLQARRYMPVHVRSTMIEEAIHGDDKRLRDYMNGCVLAARQGAVMVSPFISEKEKEVMIVLLAEERPFILLADNGFRDYYKPSAGLFDAVAAGRVLVLSPWEYDPDKKHISRADCVALNGMAEEIANS